MSPKLYLNFYDDAERIRDHMIDFLAQHGTVSKTRFGIELGTICKTPNRGRTKLVLEAYPEIFSSNGQTVSLLITPPQRPSTSEQDKVSEDKKQSNTSPGSSQKLSKSKQSTDLAMEIQPAHSLQTGSRQLSQPLIIQDDTQSVPASRRQKSFPFVIPPIASEFSEIQEDIGMRASSSRTYGQKIYAPYLSSASDIQIGSPWASKKYDPSLYTDSPEFHPTVFQYDSRQHPTSNIVKGDKNIESQQSPFHGSYEEYSEVTVINLLKHSGGSMEVSDLVLSLGISLSDSQAQHNLYDRLSASPSIGIIGEQIFLVDVVQQQSLVLEPTMQAALPEQEQEHEQQQTVSGQAQSSCQSQTNLDTQQQQQQQQSSLYEEEQEQEQEEGMTSQFEFEMSEYSSLPQQMPKSISVGKINVNNIHIQTVNLHLHIQEPTNVQVSELLKFQSLMQDMLKFTKHSA